MAEKALSAAERRAFCREYLRTMDPARAAERIGRADGFALLREQGIRDRLERMRMEQDAQIRRGDAIRRLTELAFGRANDAVALALSGKRDEAEVGQMDLSAVAEFKVTDKGGVEIKFLDRIRALEALCTLLGEEGGGAEEFFRALEEAGEE